jgi:chemotaxis response regulator CheB
MGPGGAATGRQAWSVLIVDDNDDFTALLERAFYRDGRFEVVGRARSGVEAIDVATALRPDIVVLDDEMPVRTGLEALPDLRAAAPASKIVLFSANLHRGATTLARDHGISAVSKLEPLRALIRAMEQALGVP